MSCSINIDFDQRLLQLAFDLYNLQCEDSSSVTSAPIDATYTDCVVVYSSDIVAQIVGKNGCRIKSLSERTNTYINTPSRRGEPVFVITGRKLDVLKAKTEILSASEHFNRLTRKKLVMGTLDNVMELVAVPYPYVGVVVGKLGYNIKKIQQLTNTFIKSPTIGGDPFFKITGNPENVHAARKEILTRVAWYTGWNNL